jgi:hypothetical protein
MAKAKKNKVVKGKKSKNKVKKSPSTVTIQAPGFYKITGKVLSANETTVRIKHKKKRSSTMLITDFPTSSIVTMPADGEGEITLLGREVEVDSYDANNIGTHEATGFVKVTPVGEEDYLINPLFFGAVAVAGKKE